MKSIFYAYLLICSFFTLAWGEEFQVNTRTSGAQANADIAMDAHGNFVVVWNSYNQDGYSNGIFAQRFDPNCNPVGEEFQINTTTDGNQKEPSVAMNAAGNFVVVWQGPGLDREDIFAQRFDPNGLPIGEEFRVNSYTNDKQLCPSVAVNNDGTFVVVWESMSILEEGKRAICGQLYDSTGSAIGAEFIINEQAADCRYPDVAMDPNGNFAVVWMQYKSTTANAIMAKLFNTDGSTITDTFEVSTINFRYLTSPSIAMDSAGYFVVAWDGDPERASLDDVHARLFDPNGIPLGEQFIVNTTLAEAQQYPQVAMNNKGEFVIVWESEIESSTVERDIFCQRFDSLGEPIGNEFQLNTYIEGNQKSPAVAIGEDSRFVTVWQSDDQDGSGWGIFGRLEQMVGSADSNDGIVDFHNY